MGYKEDIAKINNRIRKRYSEVVFEEYSELFARVIGGLSKSMADVDGVHLGDYGGKNLEFLGEEGFVYDTTEIESADLEALAKIYRIEKGGTVQEALERCLDDLVEYVPRAVAEKTL